MIFVLEDGRWWVVQNQPLNSIKYGCLSPPLPSSKAKVCVLAQAIEPLFSLLYPISETNMFGLTFIATSMTAFYAAMALGQERPCGFRIAPCPTGQTCSRLDPSCTRGENCAGVCHDAPTALGAATATATSSFIAAPVTPILTARTHQSCGGRRIEPAPCPEGQICIDDPDGHGCGLACDIPGICVTPTFCGGFAGVKCPDGERCVDDPRDDCDPENGGFDCGGICV